MARNNGAAVAKRPKKETANRLPKATKIAILGKAPSSVHLAPFGDSSWEIWVLNTLASGNEVPRWDRQYEIHDLERVKAPAYGNYYAWLRDRSFEKRPIFLRDPPPDDWGPAAYQYPLDEIRRVFAYLPALYLTNTVSLMIAHALLDHATGKQPLTDLGIWGVDMSQHALKHGGGPAGWFSSEYAKQRPSVEWWLGQVASERTLSGGRVRVHVPLECDILRAPCVYGHHHDNSFVKMQTRRAELQKRIAHAQQVEQQKHDEALYLSGALESTNYELQSSVFPMEGA